MAQDTYNRYTGTGRPVNDMGETTPVVEVSESVRPWGKFLPAPYLPVGRFDVHKRANIVLSVGTPVGFDAMGSLVPAGIPDGHTFVYDSEDFQTGFYATRSPLAGTAIAAASNVKCVQGLLGVSGLLATSVEKFVRPAGVTSYNVFAHEGGVSFTGWPSYVLTHSNPVNYAQHNSMAQDLVAITCDYCLLVPYVQGKNLLGSAVKIMDNSANAVDVLSKKAKSYVFAHDEVYASGTLNMLTSGLSVAFISPNCGLDDDGKTLSTDGGIYGTTGAVTFIAPGDTVGTAVDVSDAGLHIVYSATTSKYVVLRNEVDWTHTLTALGGRDGTGVLTSGAFALKLESPIQPGDFVVARVGKFVKFNKARHEVDEIIGQVLAVETDVTDKSYLSRVKSSYDRASSTGDMMPGSATRGVPFNLHMVTDGAWRQYTTSKKLDGTVLAATLSIPALRLVTINLLK